MSKVVSAEEVLGREAGGQAFSGSKFCRKESCGHEAGNADGHVFRGLDVFPLDSQYLRATNSTGTTQSKQMIADEPRKAPITQCEKGGASSPSSEAFVVRQSTELQVLMREITRLELDLASLALTASCLVEQ